MVPVMANVDVRVRNAQIGDADGIARVHVDSWRETYAGMLSERLFTEDAFRQPALESVTDLILTADERVVAACRVGGTLNKHALLVVRENGRAD